MDILVKILSASVLAFWPKFSSISLIKTESARLCINQKWRKIAAKGNDFSWSVRELGVWVGCRIRCIEFASGFTMLSLSLLSFQDRRLVDFGRNRCWMNVLAPHLALSLSSVVTSPLHFIEVAVYTVYWIMLIQKLLYLCHGVQVQWQRFVLSPRLRSRLA